MRRVLCKILKWGLISLVTLAILLVLLILEENWRGKRAWEQCKRDLEAKGEHLDIAELAPPPIPDDQNFVMIPLLKPLLDFTYDPKAGEFIYKYPHAPVKKITVYFVDPESEDDNAKARKLGIQKFLEESLKKKPSAIEGARPRQKENWQTGVFRNLQEWQTYYKLGFPDINHPEDPAEDILATFARFDTVYMELRESAKTRSMSRLPQPYSAGPESTGSSAFYSVIQDVERVVAFRAVAELRLNHADQALEDLQFGFRLIETARSRPFLIENLLSDSLVAMLMQPIWEGIAAHKWTDAQLDTLQKMLVESDSMSGFVRSMHGEIAWAAARSNYIVSQHDSIPDTADAWVRPWLLLARAYSGFFYQNQISIYRTVEDRILPLVDLKNQRIDAARLALEKKDVKEDHRFSPYTVFARMALPVYFSVLEKNAQVQTWLDQAVIACSIERYRIAHNSLPTTLDDLHAADLPHDIITGHSMHYRVLAPDNYILYSTGWNETDDGGKITKDGLGRVDRDKSDWVWSLKPL